MLFVSLIEDYNWRLRVSVKKYEHVSYAKKGHRLPPSRVLLRVVSLMRRRDTCILSEEGTHVSLLRRDKSWFLYASLFF